MASVLEVSSIAEDLLCPICLSIFQDPHMLACGHNFCLSCLESCVVPKGQHQGTCPQCRDPFDLQGATRNRILTSLAEKARLLRLEEGSQSGRAGSWYFCEEHEEPLKLFCSQDEAPVCVICRDLPQHQGHSFLPIKNAVKRYQDQLKASLDPLEDGMKWATKNQSRQQEAIEELKSLSEHLCGCIFVEFENLREILNEREQSLLEMVRQMKMDNQVEMEGKLQYLKVYKSSHTETISEIRAALSETNEFAFLKGVKELMGRIQDLLRSDETESESGEHGHRAKEGNEKDNENQTDCQGDDAIGNDWGTYGEPQDSREGIYEDIVPVDPAIGELEESLVFETWKEILRTIGPGETFAPESACSSPSPSEEDTFAPEGSNVSISADPAIGDLEESLEFETWKENWRTIGTGETFASESACSSSPPTREVMLPPGGSNVPEAAGEAALAKLGCNTEVGTTVPGEVSWYSRPKQACAFFVVHQRAWAKKAIDSGQRGWRQNQGSANKSSTHHKGGEASSVMKHSQNRHQMFHRGAQGRGRSQGQGQGCGQAQGQGCGQAQGQGCGQAKGQGHGQGQGRVQAQSQGCGQGHGQGQGRGRAQGQGRGRAQGQGRGQAQGQGRGQSSGHGQARGCGRGFGSAKGP